MRCRKQYGRVSVMVGLIYSSGFVPFMTMHCYDLQIVQGAKGRKDICQTLMSVAKTSRFEDCHLSQARLQY